MADDDFDHDDTDDDGSERCTYCGDELNWMSTCDSCDESNFDEEEERESFDAHIERIDRMILAAASVELQAAAPEPTCCRSCAELPDHIDLDRPYVWVFQSDDTLNDATFWQRSLDTGRGGSDEGRIYFEAPETGFELWVEEFATALENHGFTVERPDSPAQAFGVREATRR